MGFTKGKSGNPNGRPRKKRTLAAAIEAAGSTKVNDVARKKLLAETIWEILLTKKYNNSPVPLQDWVSVLAWLSHHIDGPVPQQLDVEQGGEVVMRVVYENDRNNSEAETASPETG